MTNQIKGKKGNFISKNKLQAVSEIAIFIVATAKLVFLFHQTGNLGIGVYSVVFAAVMLIGFLIAGTLREVICRAVMYRRTRGQYKNAVNMMKAGTWIGLLAGGIIFLILLFVSGRLTNSIFAMGSYGRFPMMFLAGALPFLFMGYAILGCFEGFAFDMAKGAAKLIFAVTDLLTSFVFIFLACRMGQAHAGLLHDENIICAFGAAGAAGGFMFSGIVALIWLRILFRGFRIKMRQTLTEDTGRGLESPVEQMMGIFSACLLPFVRNIVFMAPILIDLLLLFRFQKTIDTSLLFGSLISGYLLWFALPLLLNGILSGYSQDYLEKVMKKDDIYHGGMRIISSVKQFLCTIFPMICVLVVICPLLYTAFFTPYKEVSSVLAGCVVALFCLSKLFCSLLCGAGKGTACILCGLAACVAQTIGAVILLKGEVSLTNLLLCGLIYTLVLLAGTLIFLLPFCVYRKNLTTSLIMPFVASVAAVVAALCCQLLKGVVGELLAACLAILVSFLVHSVTLVVMGCTRKGETKEFPQGAFLSLIGSVLGIDS